MFFIFLYLGAGYICYEFGKTDPTFIDLVNKTNAKLLAEGRPDLLNSHIVTFCLLFWPMYIYLLYLATR